MSQGRVAFGNLTWNVWKRVKEQDDVLRRLNVIEDRGDNTTQQIQWRRRRRRRRRYRWHCPLPQQRAIIRCKMVVYHLPLVFPPFTRHHRAAFHLRYRTHSRRYPNQRKLISPKMISRVYWSPQQAGMRTSWISWILFWTLFKYFFLSFCFSLKS